MSAQSVKGSFQVSASLTNTLTGTSGTATSQVSNGIKPVQVNPGTGLGQCNELWSQTLPLVANTPQALNLQNLTGEGGRTVNFAAVKFLEVINNDPANPVRVGGYSIAAPTAAPTFAVAGSGGSLATGNYLASYTFTNANGETTRSPDTAPIAVTSGQQITLTLPALPTGATGMNVYLSTMGGASSTETRQNLSPVTGTSYVISGLQAGPSYPTSNTAAYQAWSAPWNAPSTVETVPGGGCLDVAGNQLGSPMHKTNMTAAGWAVTTLANTLQLDPGANAISVTVTIAGLSA